MARPNQSTDDFLESLSQKYPKGGREILAFAMIEKGDSQNLERLLNLDDNSFVDKKLESLQEIRINKIISNLYQNRANFRQQDFAELLQKLIADDIQRSQKSGLPPLIRENLLKMAFEANDLETQKIIVDNFDSTTIVELYAIYRVRALPLIRELVKKDKEKAALTRSEPKINLNFPNSTGYNILLYSVISDDIDTLRFLIKEKVDLDYRQSKQRRTALLMAVAMGKRGIAELLINAGADLALVDKERKTPLILALHSNQEDLTLFIAKSFPPAFNELIKKFIVDNISRSQTSAPPALIGASLLKMAVTNDLEIQKIIADNFNSEAIFNLYTIYRVRALPLIKELVKKDKEKAELTGSVPKINLNFAHPKGKNIVLSSVFFNDIETLEFVVSQGGIDLEYRQSDGQETALIRAVAMGRRDIAKLLIEQGADLAAATKDLETPLMLALRFKQEDLALFIAQEMRHRIYSQKNEIGEDALCYAALYSCDKFLKKYLRGDLKQYSIAVNARKLLSLMYSQDDSPSSAEENINGIINFFKRHKFGADKKTPYLLIAEEIGKCIEPSSKGNYRIDLGNGKKLEVVSMPIPGHAAFVTVEYHTNATGQERAVKISYCDGNLPLSELNDKGYGAGEVCFKVRNEWAAEPNLGAQIARDFASNVNTIMTEDNEMKMDGLPWLFKKFVETNHKGELVVIANNIATVPQDRGNCSMKSLTILQRAIIQKLDLLLKFEEKDEMGEVLYPMGNGYEEFKEYKKFIIQKCLDDILAIANSEEGKDKNNSVYFVVLYSLRSSLLQSASKEDDSKKDGPSLTMLRIIEALRDRGLNDGAIAEITNARRENSHKIAMISGALRAASFFAKSGIDFDLPKSPDREDFLLNLFDEEISGNSEMMESYLKNYSNKTLNHLLASQLMFAAVRLNPAKSGGKLSAPFVQGMIEFGFNMASKNEEGVTLLQALCRNPNLLTYLAIEAEKEKEKPLRSKIIESFRSSHDSEISQWTIIAFSAISVGSNDFAIEMVRNGFAPHIKNREGVTLLDFSLERNPKFITLLLQQDIVKFDEGQLSQIAKNASVKIRELGEASDKSAEYRKIIAAVSSSLKERVVSEEPSAASVSGASKEIMIDRSGSLTKITQV